MCNINSVSKLLGVPNSSSTAKFSSEFSAILRLLLADIFRLNRSLDSFTDWRLWSWVLATISFLRFRSGFSIGTSNYGLVGFSIWAKNCGVVVIFHWRKRLCGYIQKALFNGFHSLCCNCNCLFHLVYDAIILLPRV